ncbi:MAG: hypothetical protein Q4F18_12805 [Clostridia bacterium]|nr:hypothetical protein [Clostridia bacterium]
MSLLEKMKARRQARLEFRKEIDNKNRRGFEQNLELEKGDLLAIVIAGLFSFILPIMLVIGAICGATYFFFTWF